MIQAEELRIGNYLLIENIPQEVLVIKPNENAVEIINGEYFIILFRHHEYKSSYEIYSYKNVEPIPLTDEWLIKFIEIKWISKDINGFFYWFNGEKKYLKFVHSLQNIYYYIENKELILHSNK